MKVTQKSVHCVFHDFIEAEQVFHIENNSDFINGINQSCFLIQLRVLLILLRFFRALCLLFKDFGQAGCQLTVETFTKHPQRIGHFDTDEIGREINKLIRL